MDDQSINKSQEMRFKLSKGQLTLFRIIAVIAVIGLSVTIFIFRDRAEELAVYGYPGVFLLSFLSYATVILPAPGVAIVFAMGGVFHPIGVALAGGAGAALGEMSGYLAGFSGQAVVEQKELYKRLTGWMQKNGPLTVFLLSVIPNPLFDIAGMTAGVLKMPVRRFLFWCWLGETIKMGIFAYAGSSVIDWFFR